MDSVHRTRQHGNEQHNMRICLVTVPSQAAALRTVEYEPHPAAQQSTFPVNCGCKAIHMRSFSLRNHNAKPSA
eukprot:6189039-Prymnesium_polylepis.1